MKNLCLLILIVTSSISAQKIERTMTSVFDQFPHVRDFAITQNKDEVYFTVESYKKEYSFIAFVKKVGDTWSAPKVASFSGHYKDLEPFLSPDGLKLYFASNRVDNQSKGVKKDVDIWYVERTSTASNWSSPKNIGAVINTDANEFYPSVTENGDLFFTAAYKDALGKEDIYVSRLVNGNYTKPVPLSANVNSEKYEFNAFVSPDESFILYTSYGRKDGYGRGDLYISFKDKNNQWTPAKNLGKEINSNQIDYCPFVDLKTNTLYFTSDKNRVPKSFSSSKTIDELMQVLKVDANGLGRIYQTDISKILEKK